MTRKSCFVFMLLVAVAFFSGACRHKPAYSEIQPTESEKTRDQRAKQQPPTDPPADSAPASGTESQPVRSDPAVPPPPAQGQSPPAPRSTEIKPPPFLDEQTGEFKDLPRYPRATRTYAQVGPINGVEAGMFMLETAASYERIAEFYDQAIKKNGWTVVSNTRDPEYYKWELRKGKNSEALIEVKPDGKTTTRKSILLSRADRPEGK